MRRPAYEAERGKLFGETLLAIKRVHDPALVSNPDVLVETSGSAPNHSSELGGIGCHWRAFRPVRSCSSATSTAFKLERARVPLYAAPTKQETNSADKCQDSKDKIFTLDWRLGNMHIPNGRAHASTHNIHG